MRALRQHQPQPHAARAGFTLIEMLIYISVYGSLFWMTIQLMRLIMDVSQEGPQLSADVLTWQRLQKQLREDLHAANGLEMTPPPAGEPYFADILKLSGQRPVRYELQQGGVRRIEMRTGGPPHRELYRIPIQSAGWEVSTPDGPRLVTLTLTLRSQHLPQTPGPHRGLPHKLRLSAALGPPP